MSEPILLLVENSIQIAWDYLEQTREIDDPRFAGKFLLHSVRRMLETGERRRLRLANKAISEYQTYRATGK